MRNAQRSSERGQVLVLFVALFSVLLVLAAFSIDQGLWLNHRRIAQKDADAAARAGAAQYLKDVADPDWGAASAAGLAMAKHNGAFEDDLSAYTAPTFTPTDCENNDSDFTCARTYCQLEGGGIIEGAPSIEIGVPRPAPGLFIGALGGGNADDIGAKSTACVGSVTTIGPGGTGAIPVELFNTDYDVTKNECFSGPPPSPPAEESNARVGMQCVIKTAAQNTGPKGGDRGFFRADMPSDQCDGEGGASDIRAAIEDGLNFTCSIDTDNVCSLTVPTQDCVDDEPGNVGSTIGSWNTRLTGAGAIEQTCGGGTFKETFTYADGSAIPSSKVGPPGLNNPPNTVNGNADPPGTVYAQKACTNPRVAFIVLSDSSGTRVKGFAGIFIVGCFDERNTVLTNTLNTCSGGDPGGHKEVRAVLLRLILTDGAVGGIGDPTQNTTSPLAIQTTR